ncbi:CLUMA_CG005292, isoform A [Clunio marinus]|uniref:CLUMA_CG005292, isoform A n=1 Tax=Clunio marinus TaxID=568069 RepID=A0A1J1HU91_9DIPT|nr:CLUMA_CG005292, isoform A [Clunio marinus]
MSNKSNTIIHNLFRRQYGLDSQNNFQSKLFKSRLSIAKSLYKKDLVSHYGCVNAIEFSQDGNWLSSGGDDRRVLLWNIERSLIDKEEPQVMLKQHLSNIFCLSFDSRHSRIFSGGNDDMAIVHDIETGDCVDIFHHTKPVYGLGVDPSNDSIFATAGEDGRILLFDMRASNDDPTVVVKYRNPFHSVMFHPIDDHFMITANSKEGAALWDTRAQRMPVIRYGGDDAAQSCMSVRFNSMGTLLLALRRRLPPVLYSTLHQEPICQFYNQDYYNSCTMKSCTFAGDNDEFVLSGSDDFNLYVWRVGDADLEKRKQWVDKNQMVLYGHRSIVNQVRYNPQKCILASSGVEKIIKLWTPFELDKWTGSLTEEVQNEPVREVFTHEEYISLNMTHDYSNQNTHEDARMIAFFDYLVQQEIEGWSSESSSHNSDHTSDNSSRPDSPTSDTEPTTNFTTVKPPLSRHRETHRRGESSQRHKFRNRIAYLIATKRKTLKRLALKRFTRTPARRMKSKYVPRQTKRASLRAVGRKPYDKKMRRLSVQSKYKKPVSHEQTSDSEVPQKIKKRRTQSYTATSSYRSFRRKAKTPLSSASNTSTRVADKSDSSSDYDDEDDGFGDSRNGNLPSTSSGPVLDVNIPSTSTGITANGKGYLFRIANTMNDSDDDQSIPDTSHPATDNMLRVLRSPPIQNNHNNHRAQSHYDGVNDGAGTSTQRGFLYNSTHRAHHEKPPNGRQKHQPQEEDSSSSKCIEDYASTNSNSLMSSTEESSNDSYPESYYKKRKLCNDNYVGVDENGNESSNNNNTSSFNNNNSFNTVNNNFVANGAGSSSNVLYGTPLNRMKLTPDSGNSSLPTPSPSSSKSNTHNGNQNDVMKKIEIIKKNYRKNIQTSDDDSD